MVLESYVYLGLSTTIMHDMYNTCATNGDHASHVYVMHPNIHPMHVSTYLKREKGCPREHLS